MAEPKPASEDLALRAYLYSSGELSEPEREAFESLLAVDQTARDALSDAVQMSVLVSGSSPQPNTSYRERVRERLYPKWWRNPLARRHYRGHPLLWLVAGAAAALLLTLLRPSPPPEVRTLEKPVAQSSVPSEDTLHDAAFIWADLSTPEHVVKSHAEESRRKSRAEDRRLTRRGMNHAADQ